MNIALRKHASYMIEYVNAVQKRLNCPLPENDDVDAVARYLESLLPEEHRSGHGYETTLKLLKEDIEERGKVNSCNKGGRCPTYEELREENEKLKFINLAYQHAVNKIDDYFEYGNKSYTDQKKVYQILGNLTDKLRPLQE